MRYVRKYEENIEARKIEYVQKWLKGLNDVKARSKNHKCGDIRRCTEKVKKTMGKYKMERIVDTRVHLTRKIAYYLFIFLIE